MLSSIAAHGTSQSRGPLTFQGGWADAEPSVSHTRSLEHECPPQIESSKLQMGDAARTAFRMDVSVTRRVPDGDVFLRRRGLVLR